MAKRMLIDATHPEETRVVVLSGQRLEEFDIEAASRKPLKGNIYLAKVTRVEPSLQAAFVDYGGNRHGFLPFSEIHPDYYRIPIADREALIAAEGDASKGDDVVNIDEPDDSEDGGRNGASGKADESGGGSGDGDAADGEAEIEEVEVESSVDTLDGDEAEDAARNRAALLRKYKIQEVIKRRQVILVQVTKEERGNKGAALTTYLSLAGRDCVLMPNTPRGGGISRKIASAQDRKRLKSVLSDLEIPDGIAVIVRTAGSQRTKAEIKRDYEYLMRLWSEIRENTLQSTAPCLIHEEGDLIKRSLRDLYTRDMDEILVEGDESYKSAKNFMKQLTPSHARKVKPYKDERIPLFHRFQVENQLDAIHTPVVHMKSGGYIVLNQTEALVAIDVNSGRATKERHIEETALKTNLEAADEVARQLRLRDLAGLVVVDFIDMDESRHNREVERRFKEAMKADRARIQLGRISPFGLLEMSRQRLRPSLVETSTEVCKHCGGTGRVRSIESTALSMLRLLEEEGIKRGAGRIVLTVPTEVALFVLNQKRDHLAAIEQRHGIHAMLQADERLTAPDYRLQRHDLAEGEEGLPPAVITAYESEPDEDEAVAEDGEEERQGRGGRKSSRRGGRNRRKSDHDEGRQQEGRQQEGRQQESRQADSSEEAEDSDESAQEETQETAGGEDDQKDQGGRGKRRRRGKRGGRRRSRRREDGEQQADAEGQQNAGSGDAQPQHADAQGENVDGQGESAVSNAGESQDGDGEAEERPKRSRGRGRSRKAAAAETSNEEAAEAPKEDAPKEEAPKEETSETAEQPAEKPKRSRSRSKKVKEEAPAEASEASEPAEAGEPEAAPAQSEATNESAGEESETPGVVIDVDKTDERPKKSGWWSKIGL